MVRSGDDGRLLGVGTDSLEEGVGLGNSDRCGLLRMDDQRWAFVARQMADGFESNGDD